MLTKSMSVANQQGHSAPFVKEMSQVAGTPHLDPDWYNHDTYIEAIPGTSSFKTLVSHPYMVHGLWLGICSSQCHCTCGHVLY